MAVLTLSRVEPPAGQAGRRSGMARLKTPKVQAWMTAAIRLRMPTAAGACGLTTVPSGRTARQGRTLPALSTLRGARVCMT
ncbi:Uncharacterised protein [Bordetella pertussis]|nr:Uncharacterised protein [Bordetella pertussis]